MKKVGMKWTQVTNVNAHYHMIVSNDYDGHCVAEKIVNFLKEKGGKNARYYCRGKVDSSPKGSYSFVILADCSMQLANKACKELEGLIRTRFTDGSLWYRTESRYDWDGERMTETM